VRIAYVLKKEDLEKAMICLEKALEAYPGRNIMTGETKDFSSGILPPKRIIYDSCTYRKKSFPHNLITYPDLSIFTLIYYQS
jgi:hypothetical protein